MKDYDYIYVVCFWGTNPKWQNRKINLIAHMSFLSSYLYLKDKSCLMVICQRGINPSLSSWVTEEAPKHLTPNISFQLLIEPNWGMLVGALWDTWKFLEKEQIKANYLLALEDDWFYNHWEMRSKILDNEPIAYLGMFSFITFSNLENESQYRQWVKQGYKEVYSPFVLRWTDGGLYMLKYNSLSKIESAIGCFTKAPKTEIRDYKEYGDHGIHFGETGFPTELHLNGFKFRSFTDVSYESINNSWIDPSSSVNGFRSEFLYDSEDYYFNTYPRISYISR